MKLRLIQILTLLCLSAGFASATVGDEAPSPHAAASAPLAMAAHSAPLPARKETA